MWPEEPFLVASLGVLQVPTLLPPGPWAVSLMRLAARVVVQSLPGSSVL